MNNRNLWIAVAAAGLLAAAALGLVLRGQTPPTRPTDVTAVPPLADTPEAPARKTSAAPRKAPAAPQALADDAYVTTESGLRYHDFVVGTGAQPVHGQTVLVDYVGWLKDSGRKFDASLDREDPIAFPIGVGKVIPGWDEGVLSMQVGGRRQLVIPSSLAYGPKGRPPVIPPDATLVFEVELVAVE